MTRTEALGLSNSHIYEFFIYYQMEPIYGILVERGDPTEYYIVHRSDIGKVNAGSPPIGEFGIKVKLESIKPNPRPVDPKQSGPIRKASMVNLPVGAKPKKLVIFGAGASRDFSYGMSNSSKPPLTNELFADHQSPHYELFTGATNLAQRIGLIDKGLEDFFQERWERVMKEHDPLLLRQLISAQYYLFHLFRDVSSVNRRNNKSNFFVLSELAKEYADSKNDHVLFVSFNYDLLLEEALIRGCQYSLGTMNDYINPNNRILLFKPHGSCNWIRRFKAEMIGNPPIRSGRPFTQMVAEQIFEAQYSVADFYRMLNDDIEILPLNHTMKDPAPFHEYAFFPQLLIPFKDKDDLIMPDSHHTVLNSLLPSVEEILMIGWKGTEYQFQQLLKRTIGEKRLKITVINNGSTDIKEAYRSIFPRVEDKDWVFHKGFSIYMKEAANSGKHFFEL